MDTTTLTRFVESESKRVTVDSANTHLNFISQILDYAAQRKFIAKAPQATPLIQNQDLDDDDAIAGWPCPTAEELKQILGATAVTLAPTGKRANNGSETGRAIYRGINQNDYTDLYTTLSLTGLRFGEARNLTWGDVDLENKVIQVRPGRKNGIYWQPKTKSSIRRVPIVPQLEPILHRLREMSRKKLWVFETRRGTQLNPSNASKRFREICDGLGFKKHFVVHSLRKYWASTVASQGMDAMMMIKVFGHTDFKLIMSTYYSQNDDARMVAEASRIDFGLSPPPTAA
ncbi:MAG: site-specific integrase [Planctomycetes bacterium]|nr:site-specific integrase [Planctomycetota bacterium]